MEEIKVVRILERLLCQVGLQRWQGAGEVGDGLALAAVEIAVDLVIEDGAAPAVLDGLLGVPQAFGRVFYLLHKDDIVAPGKLGHGRR